MKDHLDKQTLELALEQKRGRGRPVTGKALSNAERQRLYRERQKTQRNEKGSPELAEALEKIKKLEAEIKQLKARQVPAGWQLVPVEPTPAMRVIGARDCSALIQPDQAGEVWRSMLGLSASHKR